MKVIGILWRLPFAIVFTVGAYLFYILAGVVAFPIGLFVLVNALSLFYPGSFQGSPWHERWRVFWFLFITPALMGWEFAKTGLELNFDTINLDGTEEDG